MRGSKFPADMHNYMWCPIYILSFMKIGSVVLEELRWKDFGTDGQTDGVTRLLDLLSPLLTQVKRRKGNNKQQFPYINMFLQPVHSFQDIKRYNSNMTMNLQFNGLYYTSRIEIWMGDWYVVFPCQMNDQVVPICMVCLNLTLYIAIKYF